MKDSEGRTWDPDDKHRLEASVVRKERLEHTFLTWSLQAKKVG